MAFGHGKDAKVLIHGRDLSAFLTAASNPGEIDVVDVSAFGKTSKEYITGLIDGTMSIEGLLGGAALESDVLIQAELGSAAARVWSHYPQGDVFGNRGLNVNGNPTSYEPGTDIGDAGRIAAEIQSDVGLESGISLKSEADDVTVTGNGATSNNGAATTAGGSAFLHVTGQSGGTNITVTLRHSTDNFSGDDTLLGTFAAQTAAGAAERIALSGTIKQYVRAVFTLGAGGTWNVNVGLVRKS